VESLLGDAQENAGAPRREIDSVLPKTVQGAAVAVALRFALEPLRGVARACNFWTRAFPFFLRYKWAEWRINAEEEDEQARERRWDRLHEHYAPFLLVDHFKRQLPFELPV
jgi:hypothetical protein